MPSPPRPTRSPDAAVQRQKPGPPLPSARRTPIPQPPPKTPWWSSWTRLARRAAPICLVGVVAVAAIGVIDKAFVADNGGALPEELTDPLGSVLGSLDDVLNEDGELALGTNGTGFSQTETTPATSIAGPEAPSTLLPTTSPADTTTAVVTTVTTLSPTTIGSDQILLLDALLFVAVTNEHRGGYSRDLFEYPISQGGGCTTRDLVLDRDSSTPVQRDQFGCDVIAGDWLSVYDGTVVTDPSEIEVDHVVALKEAWDSGAWAWTPEQRRAFANDLTDPRTLRAVNGSANGDKGASDPANWMPSQQDYWCTYLGDWVAIKVRWGLSMDQSEFGRIRNIVRERCPGWGIAPVDPLPDFFAATVSIQPLAPLPLVGSGAASVGIYFENCDAARAAGAAPVRRGDPGYRSGLDRDDDGVGCE